MAVDLDQWFFVMDYPLMNGQCKASSLETCMDLKMHPPAAFPLVSHSGIHFTFQRRICKKKPTMAGRCKLIDLEAVVPDIS